jgi:hypothetical protein
MYVPNSTSELFFLLLSSSSLLECWPATQGPRVGFPASRCVKMTLAKSLYSGGPDMIQTRRLSRLALSGDKIKTICTIHC